jgi:hypothetical protein
VQLFTEDEDCVEATIAPMSSTEDEILAGEKDDSGEKNGDTLTDSLAELVFSSANPITDDETFVVPIDVEAAAIGKAQDIDETVQRACRKS